MLIGRGEIWAVGWVFQHLETQMVNGFNGLVGRVWPISLERGLPEIGL